MLIRILLALALVSVGCKAEEPAAPKDDAAVANTVQEAGSDMNSSHEEATDAAAVQRAPITGEHYVFVGKPMPTTPLECNFWEGPDSPRRQPAPPPGDTVSHENKVPFHILEAVQNPGGIGLENAPIGRQLSVPTASVLFAMGEQGKLGVWPNTRAYCEHLQGLFAAEFVVLVAYTVDVDWRNSEVTPWKETWYSLGSGPENPNKAFARYEEALAYAKSLVPPAE